MVGIESSGAVNLRPEGEPTWDAEENQAIDDRQNNVASGGTAMMLDFARAADAFRTPVQAH